MIINSVSQKICHFTIVHPRKDVRILHKQCLSLQKSGFEVHLVVADGKGNEMFHGVHIHDLGTFTNRLLRMLFGSFRMLRILIRLKCAVYQFHDPELLPLALFLKTLFRKKVIYDSHEHYPDYFLHKDYLPAFLRPLMSRTISYLESHIGRRLDCIIVTTDNHKTRFNEINPKVEIIFNYPILSEWEDGGSSEAIHKNRNICYIGSIIEERGLTQLMKAIENVDCTIHLAGLYEPASYRDYLMKLPAWKKVIEYGYADREQIQTIIKSSLVGIVLLLPKPNYLTTLATKMFEYMAGGIACLTSDLPHFLQIVKRHEAGICINPLDEALIVESLNYLLDNPDIALEYGKNGQKAVKENYSWESQSLKLVDLYKEILKPE